MTPENRIRLIVFVGVMLVMMLWELLSPRRAGQKRALRWPNNLGIVALNSVLLLLVPLTAVGAALFAIHNHFGLFLWLQLPLWPAIILSVLVLDLVIYWQHRFFHVVPLLWPLHRMHHTDTAIDVTTGLRFHPVEIVISVVLKAVVIVLIGAPILGVILFEIILNAMAMFNHGNVRLPLVLDRVIRKLFVTPDMHRVHHSIHPGEFNSNYGFNLSLWDHLFGSYTDQPQDGHLEMQIGQRRYREPREAHLDRMLTQPFRKPVVE